MGCSLATRDLDMVRVRMRRHVHSWLSVGALLGQLRPIRARPLAMFCVCNARAFLAVSGH